MRKEESKKLSLKSQSAWLMFAKIIGFFFTFALPLVVVRILTKDNFGLYRQVFTVLMNAVVILPLGISMSAYYYLSRSEEKRAKAILNIVIFNFGVGGIAFIVLFLFPQLIGNIFKSPEITNLTPLIGLAVWIWLFSMFLETVAVANRESKTATIFIIFSQLTKTVLMISAVVWFETVESILYAAIIQGLVQTIILLFYLNSRFPRFWLKFDFGFFKEHLTYAIPFGFAAILWTAQTDIHYYFVGNQYSDAMYAVYAVGCFQLPLITILAESVTSVLIPRMSELQINGDVREMIRVTTRAMQKLAFFYFPIFVFFHITAETFIVTLFTRKYIESVPIFLVFITLLPFHIMISDPIVRSYEKLGRFLLKIRIFTFIVLFSALYFGIQNLNLVGVIAIVVGIRIVEMLIVEAFVFSKIGAKWKDLYLLKNIGKIAVISVFVGLLMYPVYFYTKDLTPQIGKYLIGLFSSDAKPGVENFVSGMITLGISFVFYSVIYLILVSYWGIIDEDEKQAFLKIYNKLRKPLRQKAIQNPQSEIQN